MSISSSGSGTSNSANLLKELNTISTPGGTGLPVSSYANAMQQALTQQLTTAPENQLTQLNSQQSALTALQSALSSFQQATQALASSQNWNSVTSTSSDPSSFTATTSAGAQASNYNISVTSLAQAQSDILTAPTSATTPATPTTALNVSGTLTIGTQSYKVNTTDSMSSIASAINNNTSTTGVQAQLLYNGSSYVLALSATKSGTANAYTIGGTLAGTANGTASTGQFSDTQIAASDAKISLDGQNFTSSTNTFDKAIPGVTLNVLKTTSTTGSLSISSDSTAAVKAVQTWMSSYNSVIDLLHTDTAFSSSKDASGATSTKSGPLFTDFNANSLLSQLPASLSSQVSGTGSSTYTSLASMGIVVNPNNGHLEFQSSSGYSVGGSGAATLQDGQSMFTQAMQQNASAVEKVFGVVQDNSISSAIPQSGVLSDVNTTLNNFLLGQGGQVSAFQSDLNAISDQQKNINNYLTQINNQITTQVNNFTTQLNQLNSAMQESQNQMKQLSALFSGSSSSSSSTIP